MARPEDEEINLDLFIGSKKDYQRLLREHHKSDKFANEKEDDGNDEFDKTENSTVIVLSKDSLQPIDEETLNMLKRTRTKHDYNEVFMQSSIEFYDEFYNSTTMSKELAAARQIRRIYKDYEAYLEAVDIRNAYIDTLIDKYGGEDEFERKLSWGFVEDWIPKMPILSKKCKDYDLYKANMLPRSMFMSPKGDVKGTLEAWQEYMADTELTITYGVETNMAVIRNYEAYMDLAFADLPAKYDKKKTVTIDDLNGLTNTFNSWYDGSNNSGDSDDDEDMYFRNSPENIEKRYYNQSYYHRPGLLYSLMCEGGEIPEEEPDPNEMVYDEETGRMITREKLNELEFIRLMGRTGWDTVKVKRHFETVSSLDTMLRRSKPRRRRNKAPMTESYSHPSLFDNTGIDPSTYMNDLTRDFIRMMEEG